ncbi:hypothetical protein PW683_01770 [Streptomyces niveus]
MAACRRAGLQFDDIGAGVREGGRVMRTTPPCEPSMFTAITGGLGTARFTARTVSGPSTFTATGAPGLSGGGKPYDVVDGRTRSTATSSSVTIRSAGPPRVSSPAPVSP